MTMEKPFAITLDVGSSRANKTGSWRTERAVYVENLPPCNNACPAGEDIQAWLYEGEDGGSGYERAWRTIMATNPFPAVQGRGCHPPRAPASQRAHPGAPGRTNRLRRRLGAGAQRTGRAPPRAAPPVRTGRPASSRPRHRPAS